MRTICAMCFGSSTEEDEEYGAGSGRLSPHVGGQGGDDFPVPVSSSRSSSLSVYSTSYSRSSLDGDGASGDHFSLPSGLSLRDFSIAGSSTNYDNDFYFSISPTSCTSNSLEDGAGASSSHLSPYGSEQSSDYPPFPVDSSPGGGSLLRVSSASCISNSLDGDSASGDSLSLSSGLSLGDFSADGSFASNDSDICPSVPSTSEGEVPFFPVPYHFVSLLSGSLSSFSSTSYDNDVNSPLSGSLAGSGSICFEICPRTPSTPPSTPPPPPTPTPTPTPLPSIPRTSSAPPY
ncbi:hypothetical protein [Candidatus Ichthyocystis hellenicum]|uniref:hypothetical protein n=1 Tax=Candidatus Ichthyocystis hellenicum TaxID=1561003 RepID=UPI000B894593|nr:hypothetical protein [Candidatus Ichthyocystis hellenicum]